MTVHSNYTTTQKFFSIKRLPWPSLLMTNDGIFDNRDAKNQLRPIILWVWVGGHFYGCVEV